MVFSGKMAITEEEMTEKMKSEVANPPSKNGQNSPLSISID